MSPSRLTATVALAFALAACSNASGTAQLVRVTQVQSSGQCPGGGAVIAVGSDSNGDGALGDDEIATRTEVCNGTQGAAGQDGTPGAPGDAGVPGSNGADTLVNTTPEPAGANCNQGGLKLEVGVDDGSGGGTAGNGTLESGEVLSTRYVCNGGMPYFPGSLTPPASPAGAFTIDVSGGAGDQSAGGAGGDVYAQITSGTLGGHTKVFATGAVDAGFTVPTFTFNGGAQLMTVSADTTLNNYADTAAGITSGDPHFAVLANGRLYANVGGSAVEVTGIDVAAGKTLTFSGFVLFYLRNDVRNAGTIAAGTMGDGVSRSALYMTMSRYHGTVGSTVTAAGASAAGATGGTGGPLTLHGNTMVINEGLLETHGGDGATAGGGNNLELSAGGLVVNTGTLDTHGGAATAGLGRSGGQLTFVSRLRGIRNAGTLDAHGGNGTTQGGNGGAVTLSGWSRSSVVNGGVVNSKGGDNTGGSGSAGQGGNLDVDVYGGDLLWAAATDLSGGAGTGAASGGNGGLAYFDVLDDSEDDRLPIQTGSAMISGNLRSKGGAGGTGGKGGRFSMYLGASNVPAGQELVLLGYTSLNASGGSSTSGTGAPAGGVHLGNATSSWYGLTGPGGSVVNYANVVANGGDGSTSGSGGILEMSTQSAIHFAWSNEMVLNLAASVDLKGGASGNNSASTGGAVNLFGVAGATNAAALNLNGGVASGGPVGGGTGGTVALSSTHGTVSNTGAVLANGGSGTSQGGGGGGITLDGPTVSNTAALSCNGGNATTNGGRGGTIGLLSRAGTTTNTGTFSVSGGTGTPAGVKGLAQVDGVDVTP